MSVQSHILNESIGESREIKEYNGRGGKKPKMTLEEFAKQFHGSGNLQLLGDWFNHINAQIDDQIRVDFVSSTEILLTKI